MKREVGWVRKCMLCALLGAAAWAMPGMQAQAADMPVKATAPEVPYWWFHGTVEAGGRFFLNNPPREGKVYEGANSLAKFYEYRDLRPGPFGNFVMSAGTSDGLYQFDVGGKNVGYDDQSYYFDFSKAGEHYFSFGWDETPHIYSTSALTPYTVNGNVLSLPAGAPFTPITTMLPYLQPTDIGIRRDTASVSYRWTPDSAWDIKADYSRMHRHGTQVDGVTGLGYTMEVPRPVDDTTHNYDFGGEYVGTSPWGMKINVSLAYHGSQYRDALSSYLVQNPNPSGSSNTPYALMSTWPDNSMNAFSGTLGADLPGQSRYIGTVSYAMMRQDQTFNPMSYQVPGFALPASSLNGAINTLLVNNVVTTRLTPELTSKLTYRYYDFKNDTPELAFPTWISRDRTSTTSESISSLSMSYTKQNAGAALTWHPSRQWTLGVAYGYERYDLTRDSVDATNENSGRVFIDWKPKVWFTLRSSAYYARRRYENFDYLGNVAAYQFPATPFTTNSSQFINPAYRQMMTDNRDRWKVNTAIDFVAFHNFTLSPTFKYQDDNYGLDRATEYGLRDSRSWGAGMDVTYLFTPTTSVTLGYMREFYTQLLYNTDQTRPRPTTNPTETNDRTVVDTFTAAARHDLIPDKLKAELRYTVSRGVDKLNLNQYSGALPSSGGQFPDMTTWYQRFDAVATYTFDKEQVAHLGWKGEVMAKLHYAWERNAVSNWADDTLAPYTPVVATNELWMGFDNPNYNVHMLMASLSFKW